MVWISTALWETVGVWEYGVGLLGWFCAFFSRVRQDEPLASEMCLGKNGLGL